ncbi:Arc family DNA-binding protein [Guyparkeria sp. SB14A]|uniref:Arc family DNA-binding protein n=1 Tax=Guyparkeria sp. SB14A TaxID=2571147 RepID=UPI0010AB915D|nr:Arc family DNA-binding protein [Guyparkeria sp. SB14A]TKA91810.1 Arc family DNA-binding protein [Guyparkeria sp. SB14A]
MAYDFPSDKLDKFMLRLPEGMRAQIKAAAEQNDRSMNSEIVARLKLSFETDEVFEGVSRDDPLSMMRAGTKVMEATLKSFEKGVRLLEIEREKDEEGGGS